MATSDLFQTKIETFAPQLAEEFGEITEEDINENALSWLDAIETRAGHDQRTRVLLPLLSQGFPFSKTTTLQFAWADGAASNWTIHRKHFSHYTPVVDFTHAICYVYAAAMAGRTCRAAWHDYVQWAQCCGWQSRLTSCSGINAVSTIGRAPRRRRDFARRDRCQDVGVSQKSTKSHAV